MKNSNYTYQDLEPYFLDFIEDKLDPEMHENVRLFLEGNPEAKEEVEEIKLAVSCFQQVDLVEPSQNLKNNFYEMLAAEQALVNNKSKKKKVYFFQSLYARLVGFAGALVLLIVVGFWISGWLNNKKTDLALNKIEDSKTQSARPEGAEVEDDKTQVTDFDEYNTENEEVPPVIKEEEKILKEKSKMRDGQENIIIQEKPIIKSKKEFQISHELEPENGEVPHVGRSITKSPESYPASSASLPSTPNALSGSVKGVTNSQVEEDKNIKNKLSSKESLSDKIAVITRFEQSNETEKLAEIAVSDEDENARIIALESLSSKDKLSENILNKLAKHLNKQKTPIAQMATIDIIVKYQVSAGSKSIKKLLKNKDINPFVKEKAILANKIIS